MSVPDFQSLMLPVLRAFNTEESTSLSKVRQQVADSEKLSEEDVKETLPSGQQTVFANRVSWAVIYMAGAGLVKRVGRGVYQLMDDGEILLSQDPPRIDEKLLKQYPKYIEWRQRNKSGKKEGVLQEKDSAVTPEETIARAVQELTGTLESDILNRLQIAEPAFLEQVVVDLLIAMGYGGRNAERGQRVGRSGDGGIDGTIREDALGLDEVYVQTKRYADDNTVGEGALRDFAGALIAAGTNKGVFVTTSNFSKAAGKYVKQVPMRIILIDGAELAQLLVKHGIGVRTREYYEIKRVDEDYFEQTVL